MKTYLQNLTEEKNLDLEHDFNIDGNIGLTLEVVIENIVVTCKAEQEKIRNILVAIDFQNGDVMHFFKHLAHGLAR